MTPDEKAVFDALEALIDAVYRNDTRAYRELVDEDVSSFESDIAPYRIDSIDFHINLMSQRALANRTNIRTDILTPRIQLYGEFAIIAYSLLVTQSDDGKVGFQTFNETRVFAKQDNKWRMVHLHRSPGVETYEA
ncbi:MAG: nuclear transport factor 2 family protein [bacterium]|jgi:ketosteroid isomerase-like protein